MIKKLALYGLGIAILSGCIWINHLAFHHALRLSQFKTKVFDFPTLAEFEKLSMSEKIFSEYRLPKVKVVERPSVDYYTNRIESRRDYFFLDYWVLPHDKPKGAVLFFHDFLEVKTSLIPAAEAFYQQGYTSVLVSFSGYGRSRGTNFTSLGYDEAMDVVEIYEEIQETFPGLPIFLYGNEMGAVAILRAIQAYQIEPAAIILNSPYRSPLQIVKNRLEIVDLPLSPTAELLVFWGGVHQGFWPFAEGTSDFAQGVYIPSLVIHGEDNPLVKTAEVEEVFSALRGKKQLEIIPNMDHWQLEKSDPTKWKSLTFPFFDTYALDKGLDMKFDDLPEEDLFDDDSLMMDSLLLVENTDSLITKADAIDSTGNLIIESKDIFGEADTLEKISHSKDSIATIPQEPKTEKKDSVRIILPKKDSIPKKEKPAPQIIVADSIGLDSTKKN